MKEIQMRCPRALDGDLKELARLRPVSLWVEQNLMPLSRAEMTLAPGEALPGGTQYVELYDQGSSLGIFRVSRTIRQGERGYRVLMEHGLSSLGTLILPGYWELGGQGMNTRQVLERLLAMQGEGGPRWILGSCEQPEEYAYSFENENLLTALLSIPGPLTGERMWTFDQSSRPWVLNLICAPADTACELRPGRNLQQVRITEDRNRLCTRLYPLGYGEGTDQLDIRPVNNGEAWLEADTTEKWGRVEAVYTDPSITDSRTLKAAAEKMLERMKEPTISVTASGLEMAALTGETLDRLVPGTLCRLPAGEAGRMTALRILSVTRPDLVTRPLEAEVILANRPEGLTEELAGVLRQNRVHQLYSQGAASEYAVHFGENCDSGHPAVLSFYVDREAVHVNRVMLNFTMQAYRAYEGLKEASGSCSAGYTVSGGSISGTTGGCLTEQEGEAVSRTGDSGLVQTNQANGLSGSHAHGLAEHSHSMEHVHHFSGSVSARSGTLTVPDHRHTVEYGIREGGNSSSVLIYVDGQLLPGNYASRHSELDITTLLEKDEQGRICRGTWHQVSFVPDNVARITADLHVRTFIRSTTGAKL